MHSMVRNFLFSTSLLYLFLGAASLMMNGRSSADVCILLQQQHAGLSSIMEILTRLLWIQKNSHPIFIRMAVVKAHQARSRRSK